MLDWFLATVTGAGELVMPYRRDQPREIEYPPAEHARFTGSEDALDWLDRQLPNVVAAIRFALAQDLAVLAWQLTDALWPLFLHRGHYAERLEVDRMGLAGARASADATGEAKMLNRVGMALRDVGQLDEAAEHFGAALVIWRQLHNDHRVAGSLRRLGTLAADRGNLDDAVRYFNDALGIFRRLGEPRRAALALSDLGATLTTAGRTTEAIAHLQEAALLIAGTRDPFNEARISSRLGRAQVHDGQLDDAAGSLDRALSVLREIGSLPGQADALESLGELAERSMRPGEARRHYEEALAILTRLGAARAPRIRARLQRLGDVDLA